MKKEIEKDLLIKALASFERSILIISPDYRILAANHLTQTSGRMIDIGQHCYRYLYDSPSPCPDCLAKEVLKSGKPASRQDTLVPENNSCLYFYPMFTDTEISSLAILDFSAASMKTMEERLHESNEFLNNLIRGAVDGIIASDMTGKIIIFNDAAGDISGYDANEVIGKMHISRLYPGDGARYVMRMLRSEKHGGKGTLRSFRVNIKNRDGEQIPISLNARVVYDKDKEKATLGFFHDLRETLKMEAELEKTRIQLVQAEKMSSLGELAAGVAHQLNNPLGGITLFSQLLMEDFDLPEEAKKDLERIFQDAQRCSNIVKELLTFSRKTSNEMHPQDINQILSETLFLVENQTLFQNIEIVKDFDGIIPKVPVDVQKIKHVFMNIILNAADAMEGKGTLTLYTLLGPDRDRVVIMISDTGTGMPQETLLKIFDPFFTTKEQGKGTGLGLSMAYRIVEDHCGKIYAESDMGEGTTFFIELLLKPPVNGGKANEKK